MQLTFVTSLFLALILPVFAASLVARDNCPSPAVCPPEKTCPPSSSTPQFCSKCPRTNVAGNPLQAGAEEAVYTHCTYKDTDCYYGPLNPPSDSLVYSYPVGACPPKLVANVCSDPLPPIQRVLLSTTCPDTNQGAVHTPVRSQPVYGADASVTQCHYANSECYYTASGSLDDALSIPKADPSVPLPAGCRPNLVESHAQYGI